MNNNAINKIKVVGAQLGEIPAKYFNGVTAEDAFLKYKDGNYLYYLNNIDIVGIKKFNLRRIISLTKKAIKHNADIIVFPELSLTGFFPYLYISDTDILKRFFETDDSLKRIIKVLSKLSNQGSIAISFGFAEYNEKLETYFNTSIYISPDGNTQLYRKTHIPGFEKPEETNKLFQFEKNIFKPSDEGYPVFKTKIKDNDVNLGMIICHDRRYNAPFLSMGLKNVNIIINGYNTPFNLSFADKLDDYVYKFHYLPLQSQAVSEGTFIISVSRAGNSYGIKQIAGTCIISPYGEILAKSEKLTEELVEAEVDFNMCYEVKAQKYWGTRSRPEALIKDFVVNGIATDSMLESLYEKLGYENLISYIENKHQNESEYKESWQAESNGIFNLFSNIIY
jgi:hypothetical protein